MEQYLHSFLSTAFKQYIEFCENCHRSKIIKNFLISLKYFKFREHIECIFVQGRKHFVQFLII